MAISLKFTSCCPASFCRFSGKRALLVLDDPMSRKWEPDWSLSLESVSQILEETRIIQDPDQFYRQTRSKVNSSELESNVRKGVLLKLLF